MQPAARLNLLKFLARFFPVVCRGLALGFAVLAITILLGFGEQVTSSERYLTVAIYGAIAVVSFSVGVVVTPILCRMSNDDGTPPLAP